jgi:hypothetical protein
MAMSSTIPTLTTEHRRSVNKDRIIYWTSTGVVALVMAFSVVNFIFNDHFPFPNGPESAFQHLRLPHYFKVELTTAKILGLVALLAPRVPRKVKEFAYFGFALTLVSAAIAHFSVGDARNLSVLYVLDPLFFLGVLAVSYAYWNERDRTVRDIALRPPARPGGI